MRRRKRAVLRWDIFEDYWFWRGGKEGLFRHWKLLHICNEYNHELVRWICGRVVLTAVWKSREMERKKMNGRIWGGLWLPCVIIPLILFIHYSLKHSSIKIAFNVVINMKFIKRHFINLKYAFVFILFRFFFFLGWPFLPRKVFQEYIWWDYEGE